MINNGIFPGKYLKISFVVFLSIIMISKVPVVKIASGDQHRTIVNAVEDQTFVRICGEIIVWMDYRHENTAVYMMDLDDGLDIKISNDTSAQLYPDVSDRYIVWQDSKDYNRLFYYDLNTYEKKNIYSESSKITPAIFGDKVVWSGYVGSGSCTLRLCSPDGS